MDTDEACALSSMGGGGGGCNFYELGVRDGSDSLHAEQMLRYFDVENHLCSLWNTEFSFSSLSLMAFGKCPLGWGLACALICGQGPAHRPHTANATVLS